MKCLLTQLHSHEFRPAESDNTIPACKKTKRHNYPQKCAQYAHYIILRTRHRWLKSKQSFQSQNTPKRCILHSNTHCLAKNRATSQFAHKLATFSSSLFAIRKKTHCQAPAPTCLFPSILLKISQNKYLKTSHCKLSVLKQEKTPPSAHCRAVFFPLHTVKKL